MTVPPPVIADNRARLAAGLGIDSLGVEEIGGAENLEWQGGGPNRADAPASAGLGQARSVAALSVPPSWTSAAPQVRTVAAALPTTGVQAAPQVLSGEAGTTFSDLALGGMAGRALGRTAGLNARERAGQTTQERFDAPQQSPAHPPIGVAGEIRELASLRDSGILTDQEFTEQKRRLLGH